MTFNIKNRLPQGVQDYLPEECYNKNKIEDSLSELYRSWGYSRIETAGFEYLSTFDTTAGLGVNKIFKFTDYDGSLLALRPDPTLQIARMAADKGLDGVQRYSYVLSSYEFSGERVSAGRTREFAQTGIELLGAKGVEADAEIVALAVESLLKAGVKGFLIEIGSVGFFKGMAASLGLSEDCAEATRELINLKDTEGLKTYLAKQGINSADSDKIAMITRLYGDEQVLETAKDLAIDDQTKQSIVRLQELAKLIKQMGLDKYCVFELGLVPELNYYSGLVIRGIAPSLGQPLLSGGRYDGLSANFGADIAAVGFSVGIKRLLVALEKDGNLSDFPYTDYAYFVADSSLETIAYIEADKLRNDGQKVVRAFGQSIEQAEDFCRKERIGKLIVFDKGQQFLRSIK